MDVPTILKNWKQALNKVSLLFIDDEEHRQLSNDAKTIRLLEFLPQVFKPKHPGTLILKVYEVFCTSN